MSGKKKGHDEEHENHERWLLTYSDMITLLMVLFIVMFAMSTVDAQKFDQLKQSLAGAFGGSEIVVVGEISSKGTNDESLLPSAVDLSTGGVANDKPISEDQAAAAVREADRAKASQDEQKARDEVDSLRGIQQRMTEELTKQGLADQVAFSIDDRGLVVTVITSSIVFGGDSAVLLPDGRRVVMALEPTLVDLPNKLEIGGHTNQLNVPTVNYPSAWELSTARASSVVRVLAEAGVSPSRMTATGHADQKPLYPPSDPLAVTRNRRVEIVVMSGQSPEVRSLLPVIATHE
ncbi:flagellar motor protein MotB [Saccharothrix violaceirubra]|uniref:Chemotaxis protein MotB n=1 Tax=Saccharothrix violaceirubra TaxID=413306 RepID=A0A7W7WYV4_9PSEU|nr:flagellar motor protein MotB [Saccharothrix violaceirubra]MBB4968371.1 chemotaxis protein MotB [Saccharothrix violaceirubra]